MRRSSLCATLLGCLFLLPTSAWADRELVKALNSRISLKVDKADPQEVFQTIGKMMSLSAQVDPSIVKPLSLQIEQVTIKTALNAACESVGCQWRLEKGTTLRVFQASEADEDSGKPNAVLKEKIDIKVNAADARNFFATVAQIMSGELSMDSSVKGTLNLDLEAQPLSGILDSACAQVQCRWRVIESSRPVLEIKPK